ncbi:MAG: S41 family peptidase [Pyrinomonadaceae bacterium]
MKTIALIARVIVLVIIALFVLRFVASAQQPAAPDRDIDAATRLAVIENLIKELNDGYVFPETATKMAADLRSRSEGKEYDSLTSSIAFAQKLTADLQAISRDKHLRVRFSYEPLPVRADRREPTAEEKAANELQMKRVNYGFERAERMGGNVGYIELRGFMDPKAGAATVAAAMTMVANTDALIFDLRRNGGGSPEMVALISSYLFDKRVHLNDLYFRPSNTTREFWTDPGVSSTKFDRDVYVLTSSYTFSAGEEFTNNLKVLKRATIVGETTGGGANPGGTVRLSEHFGVFVPTGRAINPTTKTNWEGTGVEPDVKVDKDLALKTAYVLAIKKMQASEKDANLRSQLQRFIDQTEKEINEMKKTAK